MLCETTCSKGEAITSNKSIYEAKQIKRHEKNINWWFTLFFRNETGNADVTWERWPHLNDGNSWRKIQPLGEAKGKQQLFQKMKSFQQKTAAQRRSVLTKEKTLWNNAILDSPNIALVWRWKRGTINTDQGPNDGIFMLEVTSIESFRSDLSCAEFGIPKLHNCVIPETNVKVQNDWRKKTLNV